jgi:uncharacterized repeat protein (TIGR01451 family)
MDEMRVGAVVRMAVLIVLVTAVAVAVIASAGLAQSATSANLSIVKSDSPDPVGAGSALTYTLVVSNGGPDAASAVTVVDSLPKTVVFVSADASQGSCKNVSQTTTCDLGTIAAGSGTPENTNPTTVTIHVLAPQQIKKKGKETISNTAKVSSATPDPKNSGNSDTEKTTVIGAPTGPSCAGHQATILGTPGDDLLTGTAHSDVIVGRAGNDRIFGLGGSDVICARGGFDLVKGGAQSDKILGGSAADRLFGNAGGDQLFGQRGRDRLHGGRGPDRLVGGPGSDRCSGGPGADTTLRC